VPRSSFQVLWTQAAAHDLESVIGYIAADAPLNAERVLARLRPKAESLERTPERGRVVPELLRHGMLTWRELIVTPYRLMYRIDRQAVYVLAVLDSRRDLEDLLLERLIRP
jgi:plasmid stabilization system protein ParE